MNTHVLQNKNRSSMARLVRSQSPAAFAEQYLVESIWNLKFPPGSSLPAERELAEMIGVTRTTLREVLQRLARDGWLTIQHGKPTQVNDYWQTGGLNILLTLARLDPNHCKELISNLFDAHREFSAIYIRGAVKNEPEKFIALLDESKSLQDASHSYIVYDWHFHHTSTTICGNPVFTLTLNGFLGLYHTVGMHFYTSPQARRWADNLYTALRDVAERKADGEVSALLEKFAEEKQTIWNEVRSRLPDNFVDV
jgi:GntR family negative regulator for fad regulon and positive regulator of fabA